jgi:CysZ protein
MLGFHLLDQVAFFCIAAFFYGFSFYDYSLERDQLGVLKSLKFTIFNFPIILLTGSIFLAIYYIPVIGVIISPVITVLISTYIYLQINVPTLNSTTA